MNTERKALIQAKNAVNISLKEYDIKVTKITFIGLSEHVTYRIDTDSNERYLLRIHINKLNRSEIISELLFLEFLSSNGFDTPKGIKNKTGEYVTEVEIDKTKIDCTLLKWVYGQFVRKT